MGKGATTLKGLPPFARPAAVAKIVDVSPDTVVRWADAGHFDSVLLPTRGIRIVRDSFIAYVEAQTRRRQDAGNEIADVNHLRHDSSVAEGSV